VTEGARPASPPATLAEAHSQWQAMAAQVARLERRAERERLARKEAERLLQHKSAELFHALQNSRESERHLQLALWASGEGIWSWRADVDAVQVRHLVMDGQEVPEASHRVERLRTIVHPDDLVGYSLAWQAVVRGHRADIDAACRIRWEDQWRWVRLRGRSVERDAQDRVIRIVGTIKDITSQREADRSLQLMAHAFANTHDAMAVLDSQWRIVEGNAAMARMMTLAPEGLRGLPLLEHLDLPLEDVERGRIWRGERVLRSNEQAVDVDVAVAAVDPMEGDSQYAVVALQDARERKQAQRELHRQATSDTLTGLPNRTAIQRQLEGVLRSGKPAGLIFIDLDGFKLVNDSAGHEVGDGLLRAVAQRLGEAITPPSFVGRWGGDEFIVVVPDLDSPDQVRKLGNAILARCRETVPASNRTLAVGASLGAAISPRDGRDAATLLRRADAAMYQAKENGRNRLEFFEPELEQTVRRRAELLTQLRLDAEDDRFAFEIQSIMDRQGRLAGGEMLMRWSTPAHGPVSPSEFIPLAEQAGLMPAMGRHAVTKAVEAAARLGCSNAGQVHVAVNISATQLRDGLLCDRLLALCSQMGVSPGCLDLELTESAFVHDIAAAAPSLHTLHQAGFKLSLDDFGTGYSALSQLRELPFDKVKIDRSFVLDITRSDRAARLLEGIVQMCRGLGMLTVAEGVETAEQHALLLELGVDLFQGWHFARSQPFDAWLDQAVSARGLTLRG